MVLGIKRACEYTTYEIETEEAERGQYNNEQLCRFHFKYKKEIEAGIADYKKEVASDTASVGY